MFCNVYLGECDIIRAPPSVLPPDEEPAGDGDAWDRLDRTFNTALTQLVCVKQDMSAVQAKLEEVLEHFEKQPEDPDARRAVMQVESACVVEQLQRMEKLAGGERYTASLELVSEQIESVGQDEGELTIKDDIEPNWASVCRAQWQVIQQVGKRVFEDLLPQASAVVAEDSAEDVVLCLATLISSVGAKLTHSAHATEQAIQRLEKASSRWLQKPDCELEDVCLPGCEAAQIKVSFKNGPGKPSVKSSTHAPKQQQDVPELEQH